MLNIANELRSKTDSTRRLMYPSGEGLARGGGWAIGKGYSIRHV